MAYIQRDKDTNISDYATPILPASSPLHIYVCANDKGIVRFIGLRIGKTRHVILGTYNEDTKEVSIQPPCVYKSNELTDIMNGWTPMYTIVITSFVDRSGSSYLPDYVSTPDNMEYMMNYITKLEGSKYYGIFMDAPVPGAFIGTIKRNVPSYRQYMEKKEMHSILTSMPKLDPTYVNEKIHETTNKILARLVKYVDDFTNDPMANYEAFASIADEMTRYTKTMSTDILVSNDTYMTEFTSDLQASRNDYINTMDTLMDMILNQYSPYLLTKSDASQLRMRLVSNKLSMHYIDGVHIPDATLDPIYDIKLRKYIKSYSTMQRKLAEIDTITKRISTDIAGIDDENLYNRLYELQAEYDELGIQVIDILDSQLSAYEEKINISQFATTDVRLRTIATNVSDRLLRMTNDDVYKPCGCKPGIYCKYRDVSFSELDKLV